MHPLLFVALFTVVIGLIVWGAAVSHRRTIANLRALADRHGLQLVGAEGSAFSAQPVVEGEAQGRRVRFWSFTTGSGKHRQHWVAAGIEPRALGAFSFDLQPQGMLTKLGEMFGAKEARTGDAAFDARWFLQTNTPEALAAALVPEIRARLDEAFAAGARGHFRTEGGWVCYAELGTFGDVRRLARLEGALPLLRDLADVAEVCAS